MIRLINIILHKINIYISIFYNSHRVSNFFFKVKWIYLNYKTTIVTPSSERVKRIPFLLVRVPNR